MLIREEVFDKWNQIKKSLEKEEGIHKFPHEQEVWMCTFGKNIGFEENGSLDTFLRPALIVKRFNNHMFWVIPLSTQQKSLSFYFNFIDPENRKVSAIIAQLRLISVKRFQRNMYLCNYDTYIAIKRKATDLLV